LSPYRKIETRIYGDAKFQRLSRPQPCGQSFFLWALTGPATCIIPGVIRSGPAGMAELLGWPMEALLEAFEEVSAQGMAKADFNTAPLAFIPNAIKHNPPQSPNVVKSWRSTWSDLPECPLKLEIWQVLKDFLDGMGEAFREAFAEACPKPSPNQEQEARALAVEHRLRGAETVFQSVSHSAQITDAGANDLVDPVKGIFQRIPLSDGSEYPVHVKAIEDWEREFPGIDVRQEIRSTRGFWLARPLPQRKARHEIRQSLRAHLAKKQDGTGLPEEWEM